MKKDFKVAYTNGLNQATLNGYTGAEMIKMFKDAGPIPSNVVFSKNWTGHRNEVKSDAINKEKPRSDDKVGNTIVDQLVSHIKGIGLPVFNRAAIAEFLKTHKIEGLQQFVSKDSLPKGELPSLSSALMTKYGNSISYGDVIQTANYEYTVNYKGAGEFDIIEYHQIDNNTKNGYNDRKNKGFSEYADERTIQDEVTRREYNSDSFNVEDREANGDNVGLDKSAPQRESKQSQSNDGGSQNQGWSEIKRDSATGGISPEHPIHEYTPLGQDCSEEEPQAMAERC